MSSRKFDTHKEEMLEAIAQVEFEAKDELHVIKKGTWPKERQPIIEKRLVMLDAVRFLIKKPRAEEIIANLMRACNTLMDEVCKQRATDWGIVNDAVVAGGRYLKTYGKKEE